MTTRPRVALIGTGLMGRPMAGRLLDAGLPLTVSNRSAPSLDALDALGATRADSPAQAARDADIVLTMLPNGGVVTDVLIRGGVFAAARPGTLFIDMSSVHPAIARDLGAQAATRGLRFMDAPVSGGITGAQQGTLAIMVGGTEALLEEARPVLLALGTPRLVGPVGSGQLCKLVNQVIVAVTIGAVAEGLTLAKAGGADPARVREAIMGGFCQSRILSEHGARMVEQRFTPGGTIAYQIKDLDAALDVARTVGAVLPLTARARELFAAYAAGDDGARAGDDHSALIRHIEALSGLRPEQA
ncbi:NAD(P)-dependent oxidoreductase [Deinococcus sp. KSM4-11]|uniref:NAD(P)-dependent oxidoreductase n=1 Tax=Deinococcus sp. KSM4-11 TaxID=2568654 RepID=UPI0010A4F443|nr:NAD(P)-dependent oxidoreductase [Deinococcus sp. KSM4-11]THF87084.1 NAD(P)-dependent oxidoreductase [Deinococcus sp. KSM4-11]